VDIETWNQRFACTNASPAECGINASPPTALTVNTFVAAYWENYRSFVKPKDSLHEFFKTPIFPSIKKQESTL
jgi:hypothetical protein